MNTLDGIWRSRGYGWVLRIDERSYGLSHRSRGSVIAAERGTRAEFESSFDRIAIDREGVLSLHQAGDLTRYAFEPVHQVPDMAAIQPGTVLDAAVNFETLWQTFDEHYAFFDLHGIDWQESARRLRPRVTPDLSEADLLGLFSGLLLPLDDGHVSLSTGTDSVQTLKAMDIRIALRRAFGLPTSRVSPRATMDAISPQIGDLLLAPFATTRSPLQQACNGIVSWCRLKPRIGYLSVLRLFGFADTEAARRADDLPHARAAVAQFLRDDIAALDAALDRVFTDLADCDALVLDLRINGGGFDRAGMAIANRFADHTRLAFTKRARDGSALTPAQSLSIEPARRPGFRRPVHLLTSPLCVSAGEICVLSMMALPQVRTYGMPTAGMLSDNLNKILPNGWTFSLSNEIYTAANGKVYEGVGITPEVPLTVMEASRFIGTMQSSLEGVVAGIERGSA